MRPSAHIILAVVAFAVAIPASAQASRTDPTYDTTGLDRFWELVDMLEQDQTPTENEWRSLHDHPGYTIVAGNQRWDAIRQCMGLVFQPSLRDGLAEAIEEGGSLTQQVCDHLAIARDRRHEVEQFGRDLARRDDPTTGLNLAAQYLPEIATDVPPPTVYVLLFEKNGFAGSDLALDGLMMLDMTDDLIIRYLGHELHHVYRGFGDSTQPLADEGEQQLVRALRGLASEGIASMMDKRPWLDPQKAEQDGPFWATLATHFRGFYERSPEIIADVDSFLVAYGQGQASAAETAQSVRDKLPWGGHPTGLFMALPIEDALGRERLAELAVDPLGFILAYQRIATQADGLPPFSPGTVSVLEDLRQRSRP